MKPILDWTVRADDVGEKDTALSYQAPDGALPALAAAIGVERVFSCSADVRLRRHGREITATGTVRAHAEQVCTVSLDPFETTVSEPVDVRFAEGALPPPAPPSDPEEEGSAGMADGPEPITDGTIDLGSLLQELLALGVDAYPRKPGVTFEQPSDEPPEPSPFAALAALRGGRTDGTA